MHPILTYLLRLFALWRTKIHKGRFSHPLGWLMLRSFFSMKCLRVLYSFELDASLLQVYLPNEYLF